MVQISRLSRSCDTCKHIEYTLKEDGDPWAWKCGIGNKLLLKRKNPQNGKTIKGRSDCPQYEPRSIKEKIISHLENLENVVKDYFRK